MAYDLIVFGAGASAPHGVPTFGGFEAEAGAVLENVEPYDQILSLWRGLYPMFNLEELFSFLSFQLKVKARIPVERYMGFGRDELEKLSNGPYVQSGRLAISEVLSGLVEAIPIVIYQAGEPEGSTAYRDIANQCTILRQESGYRSVEILSFNWDTIFERFLIEGGVYPHYPEVYNQTGVDWINVMKPHGSLNIEYCSNEGCSLEGELKRLGVDQESYSSTWAPTECMACGSDLVPLVLAPHFAKSPPFLVEDWYAKTWRQLYKGVQNATRVWVIGYSFPMTDHHAALTIQNALSINPNLTHLEIVTREKDADDVFAFEKRITEYISPTGQEDKVCFEYDGVEGFANRCSSLSAG